MIISNLINKTITYMGQASFIFLLIFSNIFIQRIFVRGKRCGRPIKSWNIYLVNVFTVRRGKGSQCSSMKCAYRRRCLIIIFFDSFKYRVNFVIFFSSFVRLYTTYVFININTFKRKYRKLRCAR